MLTVTVTDGPSTASKTFNWVVKQLFVNDPGDQFSLDEDTPSVAGPRPKCSFASTRPESRLAGNSWQLSALQTAIVISTPGKLFRGSD